MKGFFDSKAAHCETHGDYTAYYMPFGAYTWTGCPECAEAQIAEQAEQDESQRRAESRDIIVRHLASHACLPPRLSVSTFSQYIIDQGDEQQAARDAMQCFAANFPQHRNGESLLLIGAPGTGKSHLSCAVARYVVQKHLASVRYTTAQDLFYRVRASYGDNEGENESDIVDEMVKPALLVIDEVGIGRGTHHESDVLAAVLSRRYDAMRSTIVVSNLGLDALRTLLGERVADRLAETAEIVVFDWPSHRSA